MSYLLRKPSANTGKVLTITPENAHWKYVGFDLYRLSKGDMVSASTAERETILVLIEGKTEVIADGRNFGNLGNRMHVFERTPPHCVYVPNASEWSATATSECTLAVGSAPGKSGHKASIIGPAGIQLVERGKGNNTRYIHNIAMEDRDVADSLLVTEVFTPSGHWSSYPPHRHDEDDYPNITYLEEIYYHRLNPSQGYGHQRVFTEDGSIDETISVQNHDVVLAPKGHHPCGVPYGYEMYYLNVMAGPLRKWRFKNHPEHDWIFQRDAKR